MAKNKKRRRIANAMGRRSVPSTPSRTENLTELGLAIDGDTIRRRADALKFMFASTLTDDDSEMAAAHALADLGLQALAEGLMRDPLFVGGLEPRFIGTDKEGLALYETASGPTVTFSNGSGDWGGGGPDDVSKSGVTRLRPQKYTPHVVGQRSSTMRMLPLREGDDVVAPQAIAPVQFDVLGDEWVTILERGAVEEACIFLIRGELEIDVEGADGCYRDLIATPDGEGEDRSTVCIVFDPEGGCNGSQVKFGDVDKTLPRLKVRSRRGAVGVIVWYARRETRVENHRVVARKPSRNVSVNVVPVGGVVPVGEEALEWARKLPRLSQSETVHAAGEAAGNFSIHKPWTASLSTRHLDVRIVLFPGGTIDANAPHARHPHQDQEMFIGLHGAIVTSIIPRYLFGSQRATATVADACRIHEDFAPTRYMGAALNEAFRYEPNVLLIDSQDLHALSSANYADAVCLQVLHSENVRERQSRETQPPKPSNERASTQAMRKVEGV